MISPTDQPQAAAARRSTAPPTLWFSLALGSVLIHLVLFIIIAVMATRTAKVQLDPEPIAVEFVDPNAATLPTRPTAPSRAIAARPGVPSLPPPSNFQAQPAAPRSQPPAFNQPVEQPFVPQTIRRNRALKRTQPQFDPSRNIAPQRPSLPINPTPFQPNQPSQPSNSATSPGQPLPTPNSSPGQVPGSASNPSNSTPGTTEPQEPAVGGKIAPLQGENFMVVVSNFRQTADFQRQPPKPKELRKSVLIHLPATLANQTIFLQTNLFIGKDGLVLDAIETKLLSPESTTDQKTLDGFAKEIFTQWQFAPAQDAPEGKPLTPAPSTLRINARIQLP